MSGGTSKIGNQWERKPEILEGWKSMTWNEHVQKDTLLLNCTVPIYIYLSPEKQIRKTKQQFYKE